MSPDKIKKIKKLLDIEQDTNEGIEKYETLKKKIEPIMKRIFLFLIIIVATLLIGLIDIVDTNLTFPIIIGLMIIITVIYLSYGKVSNTLSFYKAVDLLEQQQYDINLVKELLQLNNINNYRKAKKKWKSLRNIYMIPGLLISLFLLLFIISNIIDGFNILGIVIGLFALGANIGLIRGFKYRLNIYSVGIIIEEDIQQ